MKTRLPARRSRGPRGEALGLGGVFLVECYGADGRLKWTDTAKNGVTKVGIEHALNVVFRGSTPSTSWYMGLITYPLTGGLADATDTMASHAGWSENAAYAAANRPQWSPGAPSAQAIVNGTTVDFAINATGTIYGIFIVDNNTKSGTTGTLFSTADFTGGQQAVVNGDTLKVTYTLSGQSV